jgi:hypothetical protein
MTHQPAFGAVLSWDPAGGTSYSTIAQVRDITGPDITRGDIDVTAHDSTAGYREFLPGIPDPGSFSFVLGWDPQDADHIQGVGTGIIGDFERAGCSALAAFRLVLDHCGGTATWTWDGYVSSFSLAVPLEGEYTSDVSLKISGKPTLAVT